MHQPIYRNRILPLFVFLLGLSLPGYSQFVYPDDYLAAKTKSKTYTREELQRFADLGRLWGAIHYLNPKMATGGLSTDSLLLPAARQLVSDPSATGFRNSVGLLLNNLGDASTRILTEGKGLQSKLFTTGNTPVVHRFADSTYYVVFPTVAMDAMDVSSIPGLMPWDWKNASSVIIDIRNEKKYNPFDDFSFLYEGMPVLINSIAAGKELPAIYEKSIYHNGFVSQVKNNGNIYSSGWTVSMIPGFSANSKEPALGKPVTIVYSENTGAEIVKQLSVLREAGLVRLVYEGDPARYTSGDNETLMLADSLAVSIRLTEYQLSGGKPLPKPDLSFVSITDTSLDGSFMSAVRALHTSKPDATLKNSSANGDFILPKPSAFDKTQLPETAVRLYGLFNFWNAIHYFSPYKNGLDHSWDSVLLKYIPVFLNADDTLSYGLALRALASETQDCHGFFGMSGGIAPTRKMYGYWPGFDVSFIGHKLYISEITADSTQDLSVLRVWDEVKSVDGLSIAEVKNKWRHYFASSNEDTYERDLVYYMFGGPIHSAVKLELLRNGKPVKLEIKRSGRWNFKRQSTGFNHKHRYAELLPGNIGYINMGSLPRAKVDSTFKAFENTGALILDLRNYPQGTAWNIAPKLTDKPANAVRFDKPYVNLNHLRGGEDKVSMTSWFTVIPSGQKPYMGKLIILCNESTQSQAEYSIMMFQGARPCTVIGSRTAGADGNVTEVLMPGGFNISFSGLGIYYPDGSPTQRTGIRVDREVRPTIEGIKAGRDEVLENAIRFIQTGK